MALKLTKEQKIELVEHLRDLKQAHIKHLQSVASKAALRTESKVHKRLKKVSMMVRSVPIQEVLNCEWLHTPTMAEIRKFARNL